MQPPTSTNSVSHPDGHSVPFHSKSMSGSFDGKKPFKPKDFIIKNGQRYHAIGSEKAPYPLAYDACNLDIARESMHVILCQSVGIKVSIVPEINLGPKIPTRSLDLGTGVGHWVIHAAQHWPNTTFVGLDLVDVQIRLDYIDQSIASRIHLSNRLPFDDGHFDYIRVMFISKGVPEIKWMSVFEECHRVLAPGGVIELGVEDILFPTLPRWFTAALHETEGMSTAASTKPLSDKTETENGRSQQVPLTHDFEFLENLYYGVFESRFINLKPTSTVPGYFNTVFANVQISPPRSFPQPPYNFPALRRPSTPSLPSTGTQKEDSPVVVTKFSQPSRIPDNATQPDLQRPSVPLHQDNLNSPQYCLKQTSASTNQTLRSLPSPSIDSLYSSIDNECSSDKSNASYIDALTRIKSPNRRRYSAPSELFRTDLYSPRRSQRDSSSSSFTAHVNDWDSSQSLCSNSSRSTWTVYGFGDEVLSFTDYYNVDDRLMFMHLYIAFTHVCACREPMWEELSAKVQKEPSILLQLGCSEDELSMLRKDEKCIQRVARRKFDEMFSRYCSDMQIRLSFADSMEVHGWPSPAKEPATAAQRMEQERLLRTWEKMSPDQLQNKVDDLEEDDTPASRPVRLLRGFWGYRNE